MSDLVKSTHSGERQMVCIRRKRQEKLTRDLTRGVSEDLGRCRNVLRRRADEGVHNL